MCFHQSEESSKISVSTQIALNCEIINDQVTLGVNESCYIDLKTHLDLGASMLLSTAESIERRSRVFFFLSLATKNTVLSLMRSSIQKAESRATKIHLLVVKTT